MELIDGEKQDGGAIHVIEHGSEGFIVTTKFNNMAGSSSSEPVVINPAQSTDWILWGDDNLKPQKLVKIIEQNDLIPTIIERKKKIIYSQGVAYGFELIDDATGKKTLHPVRINEIDDFLEGCEFNRYLLEAADDKITLNNNFIQFRKNLKGEIIDLGNIDATMCRLSVQDKNTGRIKSVFVDANWDTLANAKPQFTFDALDPYYKVAEQIVSSKKTDLVLPLRSARRGRTFYDRAPWEGLIDTGWLPLAQQIPSYKTAIMNNQLSIKWHIKIPDYYWTWRFKDWDTFTDVKKKSKVDTVVTEFITFMKGTGKAGSAFVSHFKHDIHSQKELSGWQIEPILNGKQGGEFLEDSQEADFHICRAFDIDPTLIGISPGKNQAAGSGSDKRVVFNQTVLLSKSDQDELLKPLQITSKVNGWNEKYKTELKGNPFKAWTESYFLATLDQVNNDKRM